MFSVVVVYKQLPSLEAGGSLGGSSLSGTFDVARNEFSSSVEPD